MKKSIILIILLLGLSHNYTLNNYTLNNYFNNLTCLEKEIIKIYALHYPNAFVIVNMLI